MAINVEAVTVTTRAVNTQMMAFSRRMVILSIRYSRSSLRLENNVIYSNRVRIVKISIIPDERANIPVISSVFLLIIRGLVMDAK